MPLEFETTGQLVLALAGGDVRPPPRCLSLEVQAEDGRVVSITFPNDSRRSATVRITEREQAEVPYTTGAQVRHRGTDELGTVVSCEFNGPVVVRTDRGATVTWDLDDVQPV